MKEESYRTIEKSQKSFISEVSIGNITDSLASGMVPSIARDTVLSSLTLKD
jgi:hypothetical protein